MAGAYSYKSFFRNLYRNLGQAYAFQAQTPEEAGQWRREFRQALREALGLDLLEEIAVGWNRAENEHVATGWGQAENEGQTEKEGRGESGIRAKDSCPWTVEQLERVEDEGYIRYKFRMETLPRVFMPFYMLVPEAASPQKPARAVIAIPAHGANKDTVAGVPTGSAVREKLSRTPKEAYGLALVKRGYVALCPDPPGYGERIEPLPTEATAFAPPNPENAKDEEASASDPLGCSCKDLAQTAEALSLSLTALEIWDLMRLADFAIGREEIDGKRIGCMGFSGGGQYAMWLAAMDQRIQAAVVSGYVHGYYDSILDVHLCPCNYAPRLWRLGDISDICSLIAPRPLFVENGLDDPLNGYRGIEGPKEQVDRIRKAYRLYGQEGNLVHVTPEGGHQWYGECYEFLDRML